MRKREVKNTNWQELKREADKISVGDRLKFSRINCAINNYLNPHTLILEDIVKQITGIAKTNS